MTSSVLETVLDLHHANPDKRRFTCPYCLRYNALSISVTGNELQYHCFGADCKTSGNHKERLSVDQINKRREVRSGNMPATMWVQPAHFVSPLRLSVISYLRHYHILEAYEAGRVDLKYDPRQDRLVFLIKDGAGNVVNGAGRLLKSGSLGVAKWMNYGGVPSPFICGSGDDGCIVEDCTSAARISSYITGIAVLGTNFKETNLALLKKYKRIFICLDKDALRKSLEIEKTLRWFTSPRIVLLEKDLKELDDFSLKQFVESSFK